MASPQAAWQVVKFISDHPRLKIGLLSVAGCLFFKKVLYVLWLRWLLGKKIARRRADATAKINFVRELCQETQEIDLSNQTAERLVKAIKNGNLTAEEVLNAFTKKALELNNEINAVTEPVTEAWNQVKMLDSLDEKNGLLHGLPISIKENIHIGGYDASAGISKFLNNIILEDAVIVKVLKKQGAVPFMRTNLPQTMMSYCSSNPIYGETCNPHDVNRSPGGSSSGEAALIGGGGSVIGIGTDVGGSIRIPANFCGVYSLMASGGRLSANGTVRINSGRVCIQGTMGLMAKDFESLVLVSKAAMSKDMWTFDPSVPQLPFNQQEFNKTEGLRIGYYTFDGNVQCQPPVVRAVMEAKEALERKGHTLVPVNFPMMFKSAFDNGKFYIRLMAADRGEFVRRLIDGDKEDKGIANYLRMLSMPPWFIRLLAFVSSQMDPFLGKTLKGFIGYKSVFEYFQHVTEFVIWKERFMESWMEHEFDAIICPVFPSAAPTLKMMPYLTAAGLYCQLYNSLNYPSGCIPITKVTKKDVEQCFDPSVYKPQNLIEKLLLKSVKGMEGLPVGIQCVALPYKDEMCLRVMRDIDMELGR